MDRKLRIVFAVIGGFFLGWNLMWATQAYGGEYVTYTDPKTGVRYYGDGVPPAAPSNVRIEVRQHESVSKVGINWTTTERSKTEQLAATTPKPTPQATQQYSSSEMAIMQNNQRVMSHLEHSANKPLPPTRGRVVAEFNARTNAHERYQSDMLDWRMKGHDIGYKYTPTGFSEGERRHYESIGSFDRAFRRK